MTINPVVLDDVLNDVLAMGALAAQLYVKNPNHQAESANLINAVSQVLSLIESQINKPVVS